MQGFANAPWIGAQTDKMERGSPRRDLPRPSFLTARSLRLVLLACCSRESCSRGDGGQACRFGFRFRFRFRTGAAEVLRRISDVLRPVTLKGAGSEALSSQPSRALWPCPQTAATGARCPAVGGSPKNRRR